MPGQIGADMKKVLAVLALVALATPAYADYVRAKPGNDAAKAEAYCNMVARGSRQGFFAFGNPDFVAGAAIGNGLGNIIRQARTKQDCMTMLGYEWKKSGKKPRSTVGGTPSHRQKP